MSWFIPNKMKLRLGCVFACSAAILASSRHLFLISAVALAVT